MEKMEGEISFKTSGFRGIVSLMFWRKNYIIVLILILASFLRLYKIWDYMTFLGDEGRDVLVAKDILNGNLTLLGPRSSAADFFYGPIYYYLITPFLWLFRMDPVGPAVMVALIGIATVFLVYLVGKKFFGEKAGLIAALLYAISPLVISYSRSSWNPNPLPFVSLLSMYILYLGVMQRSWKKIFIVGILLGIAMQLQYVSMFLAVIIVLFLFLVNIIKKYKVISLVRSYLVLGTGFLIGFSPFLAFEVRHGFPNIKTIFSFIFASATGEAGSVTEMDNMNFTQRVNDVFFRVFARLVFRYPPPEQVSIAESLELRLWQIGIILVAFTSLYVLVKHKDRLQSLLLLLWFVLGVAFFGFYKDSIYDYHFGFMFTVPFLLIGNLLSKTNLKTIQFGVLWYVIGVVVLYNLSLPSQFALHIALLLSLPLLIFANLTRNINKEYLFSLLCGVVLFTTVAINLYGYPFASAANRQKDQVRQISEFVLSKTGGKPFNFALLTLGNSDHAYRYYLEINNRPPVVIENVIKDPKRNSVTEQLLIVCEDPNCQPLGASLWEVAGFGRAEIVGEWNVSVVKVFKLVHYQGED